MEVGGRGRERDGDGVLDMHWGRGGIREENGREAAPLFLCGRGRGRHSCPNHMHLKWEQLLDCSLFVHSVHEFPQLAQLCNCGM